MKNSIKLFVLGLALSSQAMASDCAYWTVNIPNSKQVSKASLLTILDTLGSNSRIQVTGILSFAETDPSFGRNIFYTTHANSFNSIAERKQFEASLANKLRTVEGISVYCVPPAVGPGGLTGSN